MEIAVVNLYPVMTIAGPVLLGLVLLFAVLSNRAKRKRSDLERTEQGTRDLRQQLDREDKAGGS
jgi:hypothetical protein